MTKIDKLAGFSRRALLKTGGALVVSVGMPIGLDTVVAIDRAFAQGTRPPLTPDQLSSYIAVNADGTISAFFGKIDGGQGVDVAIGQIVADELDVPFAKVKVVMGDSATSVNQGGASNASGIEEGAVPLRNAAAEARRVLVEMAAGLLSVPADKLVVNDGVVSAADDTSKRISYAQMIGGRYFNVPVEWNKKWGNPLSIVGKAKPKKPADYKIVGQTVRRNDVAPKVFARFDYITDVKVPGMVHGRMLRPAGRRRGAGERGRELAEGHSRRPRGVEAGLPRRGRRQGMGRGARGPAPQGDLVAGDPAVPQRERAVRPHP